MQLTEQQWKVLRLYLLFAAEGRVRAVWLDQADRKLGDLTPDLSPPANAYGVKVGRLADDGDDAFRGELVGRTQLRLADAEALAPCWAVPFEQLSLLGAALASSPWIAPEPDVSRSYKSPPAFDRQVVDYAKRHGLPVTAIIIRALTTLMEREP